jgi:hypothetical protein
VAEGVAELLVEVELVVVDEELVEEVEALVEEALDEVEDELEARFGIPRGESERGMVS